MSNAEEDYVYNTENEQNTPRANAVRNARNEQRRREQEAEDMENLLRVCELMEEHDLIPELLENPLLANEKQELITIYKITRMSNEERIQAYGTTFRKIKATLSREAERVQKEANNLVRSQINAAYNEGVRVNTARFRLRNTIKAKRAENMALLERTTELPQNIKRIQQQGRYAKPENTRRAKNFVNARNKNRNNATRRLKTYNSLNAKLNGKHYPIENYERMLAEME